MRKIIKHLLSLVLMMSVAFSICSCDDPEPDDQQTDSFVLMISSPSSLSVQAGQDVTFSFYSKKGPVITDKVVFKDAGKEYVADITTVTDDSFTFKLPADIVSGTYVFCIRRDKNTKEIGRIELTVEKPETVIDVKPEAGSTIYGVVHCQGKGIEGVAVTDGYEMTLTDKNGVYQLKSEKKNSMVYITTPAGYTAPTDGVQAKFYKYLTNPAGTAEQKDFALEYVGDQTYHTMLFFGDIHLANRTADRSQFATFTSEINSYLKAHNGEKIYAMTLGDMTWDLYWYSNNYEFTNYLADVNAIKGLTIYHTMGNHDHNMRTSISGASLGWDAVNWDTEKRYREVMGPNYYSFNIGKVHYIVLDNIYCTNTTGGASGDRHYVEKLCTDDLNWLKKDLKYVDKNTPIVVTMHSPVYTQTGSYDMESAATFIACFDGYNYVRFVTGHSHKMWSVDKPHIHEHNSGAICATWWWAGNYNRTLNLAPDGAPGGYRIMTWNGAYENSFYKGTGRPDNFQFRTYDRNQINIKAADCGVTSYASDFDAYLTKYGKYNTASTANEVIINVWDYNSDWKVSVKENGKELKVTQFTGYDPLFFITYTSYRFKSTNSPSFGPYNTYHLFKATASSATSTLEITVTDDENRIYTETMKRPKAFSIDTYK